ncbi:MAG: biotin/lipoyl-containing protein, partial [Actinomycetota bacterium]
MATEIKMPQLGETVVEGTITRWLKQEGDTIEEDELLVEISTDKVDSEVPSSASGVIQKILVQEGETVNVGTPLAIVGEGGESAAEEPEAEEDKQEPAAEQSQDKGDEAPAAPAAEEEPAPEPPKAPEEPAAEERRPQVAARASNGKGDTSKR